MKLSLMIGYDTLYGASWAPNGKMVAVGCPDNTLRAFDPETGKQVLFSGAHNDWALDTTFSVNSDHLISVSRDMSMKLIEVKTERFIDNITSITPTALKGGLMAIERRPTNEKKMVKIPLDDVGASVEKVYDEVLAAGADGTPRLYKMHREKKRVIGDDFNFIKAFEKMPGRVSGLQFNAAGSHFAAACSLDGKGDHILATRFLSRFVPEDIAWAHVDLASATRTGGLAYVNTDVTGFGVRYALELILKHDILAGLERSQ